MVVPSLHWSCILSSGTLQWQYSIFKSWYKVLHPSSTYLAVLIQNLVTSSGCFLLFSRISNDYWKFVFLFTATTWIFAKMFSDQGYIQMLMQPIYITVAEGLLVLALPVSESSFIWFIDCSKFTSCSVSIISMLVFSYYYWWEFVQVRR